MKILVGSQRFFQGLEGFKSKDKDVVIFEENPSLYNFYMQRKENGEDTFRWNIVNVFNYDYNKVPMAVGKFLVPEILTELNKTFEEVKPLLNEFLPKLSARHHYQQKIYEFYLLNNDMTLTESQLEEVYQEYLNGKM